MIVKSFLLKQDKLESIAALCDKDTIAVVRPQKRVEALFMSAIRKTIVEKKSAAEEFKAIREYFIGLLPDPTYQQTVESVIDGTEAYLREGMYVQTSPHAIEDFVLAKCARLAAEAVHFRVGGRIVYGTELMICHTEQHFDWAASKEQMTVRLAGSGPIVIPGGYGRLMSGYVVRTGKDGAHLMASLIGSALGASSIEFYIEGRVAEGVTAMTFDEATHFCSVPHAAFASSDIDDPAFEGTIISTGSAHQIAVLADKDLALITVYGTGLLGKVGMSSAIFSCLAKEGVNVRFIAQTSSEYSISFAVRSEDRDIAEEALKSLFEENPLLPLDDVVVLNQEVGIVTVFGSQMRKVAGTSGKVFSKLGDAGISIIASAQGGEELSISLVLDEKDVDKAVDLLR